MPDITIQADWVPSDDPNIQMRKTAAALQINVNGYLLTKNVNTWSKSVQDAVIVSTYPLAQWFAYHWWRLENELVPNGHPSFEWKFAHVLGAANHGFVWPQITFASDGSLMNISTGLFRTPEQSVEYICQADGIQTVSLDDFQNAVKRFIETTTEQLADIDSDLKQLWKAVCEDIQSPRNSKIRKMEGALGYDPEECPEELITLFLKLQKQVGSNSIKELTHLAPNSNKIQSYLTLDRGYSAALQLATDKISIDYSKDILPWQQGVSAARQVRTLCNLSQDSISENDLRDILKMSKTDFSRYAESNNECPVSFGRRTENGNLLIVPRTHSHSTARCFELSRLIGDALTSKEILDNEWLISSDCRSFRQKRQRAFAAELLCPINSLLNFLNTDYSDSMLEAAAEHFGVSDWTVRAILVNHKIVSKDEILPCII